MKKFGLAFLLIGLIGFTSQAQISDPAYKEKILKVVRIQGAQDYAVDQAIEQMSAMISDEKQKAFEKEMKKHFEELIDETADIYMKNYSKKEIDALYDFYNSSVGKKIQKKMPKVLEESNTLSQKFAQQLMPVVQKYMD